MMGGQPQPFLYPGMYNPGQFAFGNNAEMSQLISMFAGPLLGQMAGPGNFMPHMMPGQALYDQFTMRNYQNQTRTATFNMAGAQDSELAKRLLGMRSVMTGEKASELNESQAMNMAGMLNNPMVKSIMGMAMGPDNLEALLHGSKGDVQNLGNTINRIGYFRRDPGGGGRMDAESLEDLTTGVFSHLYEPQGDTDKLAQQARDGDERARKRLREASRMEEQTIVEDVDVAKRLQDKGSDDVDRLYKKYVQGGEATDTATQAKELAKFDRAIKESGVLHGTETTIGMMQSRAERMPTEEMHGFMAGQVSQLAENLAQRGVLPPSVGALSQKDRVGAIAETKLDDATVDRLARTMAKRDLESRDDDAGKRYREMDAAEKDKELDRVSGSYRSGIEATKAEAEKYARGESSKSADDILKGAGGEALAGNVDASRTAGKLKEYTEALSAVRDIFGDNGNPNAPMPALMAALDQLTQGGMGQMKPAQVAGTLRAMQTLARETGTGMQQLAQMSAVAGNMGQQLGIAPSITMQNVAATMGLTKSAMDSGAFSTGTFGTMNKEQFQMESMRMLQEGDASGNAKSMAALARIYAADPDKFKGTELEAAVAAYNDPSSDGTYTDPKTGEKRNLYELVGKGGHFAAQDILQQSGGTQADFQSVVYDPLTQQYARAGAGYMTQKHERVRNLTGYSVEGAVRHSMEGTETLKGMDDQEIFSASEVVTGMIMDSADMGPEAQMDYLQNNMKEKLTAHFKAQGKSDTEAAQMAGEMTQKMTSDRSSMSRMIGNVGTVAFDIYGQNLAAMSQQYGHNRDVYGMLEVGDAKARAEAHRKAVGYESTIGQRASDYFLDIGKKGEKFNLDQFMKAMAPVIGDNEVLQQYAGTMGGGMHTIAHERDKYQVTEKRVEQLHEKATKGDEAAREELRRLGNVDKDTQIITQAEIDREREEKISGMSDADLEKAYQTATGLKSGAHLTKEQKQEALRKSDKYKTQFGKEYKDTKRSQKDGKYMTEEELRNRAMGGIGTALAGQEGKLEDLNAIQNAFERGQDTDALRAGVSAMFRVDSMKDAFSGMSAKDKKEMEEAIMGAGDSKDVILKKLGMSEEEFQKGLSTKPEDKSAKQKAAETAVALDSAKNYDLDKMGAEGSKQKVEKAEIDATTVVIKADKVEGVGGAAGAAAGAEIKSAGAAVGDDMKAIDAELASIGEKEKSGGWGGWGLAWAAGDGLTDDQAKRRAELLQKKEELAQKEVEQKTSPAASPETPKEDKPLEEPTPAPTAGTAEAAAETAATEVVAAATGTPVREINTDEVTIDPNVAAAAEDAMASRGIKPPSTVEESVAAQGTTKPTTAEEALSTAMPDAVAASAADGLPGGHSSANILPASFNPQQQSSGGVTTVAAASGGGGGGDGRVQIAGKLELVGLNAAIITAMGQKTISTPGNGPSVVADPPRTNVT
jgi:hypothetical protein